MDKRLSFREIAEITGVSKGSLSVWLKSYPLTDAERRGRMRPPPPAPKKDRGQESEIHKRVIHNQLDSNQKSKVAEAAVMLRLLVAGFHPFGSVFDGDRTDWLVEIPKASRPVKVQVKLAYQHRQGVPLVSLRSSSRKQPYQAGDFDFLVGFNLFTDTAYVWSWEEVRDHTATISIHRSAAERWDKFNRV